MHRIFRAFIDRLAESVDPMALRDAVADAAFDLHCFAYLSMPHWPGAEAQFMSTYPSACTGRPRRHTGGSRPRHVTYDAEAACASKRSAVFRARRAAGIQE